MGYRGYGAHGQWATMGTGVWATWAMGNRAWAMGHMGHGAHGQWGPWAIGTFLSIASLLLDGFLQKFY